MTISKYSNVAISYVLFCNYGTYFEILFNILTKKLEAKSISH